MEDLSSFFFVLAQGQRKKNKNALLDQKFPKDNQALCRPFTAWLVSHSFSIQIHHVIVCLFVCFLPLSNIFPCRLFIIFFCTFPQTACSQAKLTVV